MSAVEETLSLCGLTGFFREYVPVFLVGKMYIENRNLRGVQKFVEASVVRRNSIGCNLVSANSCTPCIMDNYFFCRC